MSSTNSVLWCTCRFSMHLALNIKGNLGPFCDNVAWIPSRKVAPFWQWNMSNGTELDGKWSCILAGVGNIACCTIFLQKHTIRRKLTPFVQRKYTIHGWCLSSSWHIVTPWSAWHLFVLSNLSTWLSLWTKTGLYLVESFRRTWCWLGDNCDNGLYHVVTITPCCTVADNCKSALSGPYCKMMEQK